jgi:Acetoacetate decarboxylase (ADC)
VAANGIPGYRGGILNMTGARPGEAFRYDGPTMPEQVYFTQTFTSTYEAIERLIVPPPLEVDREMPPEVQVMYFTNIGNVAFDGRPAPYQACMFMARVKHGDLAGRAGWEYVDGVHGDKTDMDVMGSWSVYFGMLKKFADIRFYPVGVNEFEMTVTRRGVRLVTMRLSLGSELPADVVAQMNAATAAAGATLTVREIPDQSYTGFVDRAICVAPSNGNTISRAWSAEAGSLEFGHLELDPLDELPVLGTHSAAVFDLCSEKELFTEMKILEHLPLDVPQPSGNGVFAAR